MNSTLNQKITVLINSCDDYEDLWIPFFTLFKKYWNPKGIRILLNTESKSFQFKDLDIECIHPENPKDAYGKRMIHALSQIKTPYVIPLLDDFFLRKEVNTDLITQIIKWMDHDKHIAYFNCDCTETFYDYEVDKYPGFKRIPKGNEYTLNMQAAVWRTKKLLDYWLPDVSPWEWECFTNLCAARNKRDKFYCVTDLKNGFCDYGFCLQGMGVFRGKWVKNDVVPLFEKENIHVDFSKRGFYSPKDNYSIPLEVRDRLKTLLFSSDLINRCLEDSDIVSYSRFLKKNRILGLIRGPYDILYIKYALAKERKMFVTRRNRKQRLFSIFKRGFLWRIFQ